MVPLTEHQKNYLLDESSKHTLKKLARETGLSETRVQEFCEVHLLTYRKATPPRKIDNKKYRRLDYHEPALAKDPPKPKVNRRFPGDGYSNTSPLNIAGKQ